MTPVHPRDVGIGAGVLVGAYLLLVFMLQPVPPRLVAMFGGAQTEFERFGGLQMVWIPPPDADPTALERILATRSSSVSVHRKGEGFELRVANVKREQIEEVAGRIARDRLEFHEVVQVDEMRNLASVLSLPMKGQRPVDVEIDQWQPDDGGAVQTDFYLFGDSPAVLDAELAEAKRRGWSLPAGVRIAIEHVEWNDDPSKHGYRTYVIRDKADLDGFSIANAMLSYDPNTNRPIVLLDFNREGGRVFGELTGRIVGRKLAILVGDEVRSAPVINGAIRGGRASITMGGSDAAHQHHEAEMLVETLKVGALPPGGQVTGTVYVAPASDELIRLLARLLLVLGGGLVAGALAWIVTKLARPVWRPAPPRAAAPIAWRRIGVTLLAPISLFALSQLTVLGIDKDEYLYRVGEAGWLGAQRTDPLSYISIGALGIMPILSSFVLVELVAVVLPSWRRRRHAGPVAREPIMLCAIAITALVVTLQGWFFVQYFAALGDVIPPGMWPRIEIIGSLGAGTLTLALVAGVIRRHGVGNGYSALFVAGWAIHLGDMASRAGYLSGDTAIGGATILVVAVVVGVALRLRISRDGERTLRVPTSGIAPLSDAGGLVVVLVLLARVPLDELVMKLSEWTQTLHDHRWLVLILVAALTIFWSLAFARRAVKAWSTWWAATVLSIAVLVLVAGVTSIGIAVRPTITWVVDAATVALVTAFLLDAYDDLKARRRSLESVWSLHSAQNVDVVERALTDAGIPCHFTATHTRTLLAFFGPFVPIDVLVPAEMAPEARSLLSQLSLA